MASSYDGISFEMTIGKMLTVCKYLRNLVSLSLMLIQISMCFAHNYN